jgi:hypothetical protein
VPKIRKITPRRVKAGRSADFVVRGSALGVPFASLWAVRRKKGRRELFTICDGSAGAPKCYDLKSENRLEFTYTFADRGVYTVSFGIRGSRLRAKTRVKVR